MVPPNFIQTLLTVLPDDNNNTTVANVQIKTILIDFDWILNKMCYLGVQQCFGVVYHELTTLRQVYSARAALFDTILLLTLSNALLCVPPMFQ